MSEEHRIINAVYAAKRDLQKADALIRTYIPFIRSQAARYMLRRCTEQDDEYSIAMMAFYEAIMGYEKERGAFFSYAAMLIRSRLIDYSRKELRHQGVISLYEGNGEGEERNLLDTLGEERDIFDDAATRDATRQEIEELAAVMRHFHVCFADVAENCPKQERTMDACAAAIRYAARTPFLLEKLLQTGKVPMAELVRGSGVERKTLERHRKYILAMLLIQTNGYEIMRGHLRRVLKRREESAG